MLKATKTLDYTSLANKISKKAYLLEDVKDRLEKVAFDVVRFKDGDEASNLWKIEQNEEGNYIVALYEDVPSVKEASDWNVTFNKTSGFLNVFYKGDHLCKVASSSLGVPVAEVNLVESYLPRSLNKNKVLVKKLLNQIDKEKRQVVLSKYPELA